jgi:hypothetical protein
MEQNRQNQQNQQNRPNSQDSKVHEKNNKYFQVKTINFLSYKLIFISTEKTINSHKFM